MAFEWSKEAYDALPNHVKKVRHILEIWYQATEDGSVGQWMPMVRPGSKPTKVTADYANRLVEYLDASFEREIKSWANQIGYDSPPGFCRLDIIQRMMLAQEVANAMEEEWERVREEEMRVRKEEEGRSGDNREQPTGIGTYDEAFG